jgi:hypothetical protein
VDVFSGSLRDLVRREERVRVIPRHSRVGYWHYDPFWCDDDFRFRWYVFDPFAYRSYCSPWYYYPHLPAYVDYSCVRVLRISLGPLSWINYSWNRPHYGYYERQYQGSYYSDLDYALDDLVRGFEDADRRSIGRVIPRYGDVHVWVDGTYNYTMDADRFYDLMLDNVFGTRTRRYEITKVRTYGNEAEVTARHEFLDPWGDREVVYHWYRLYREREGYVIRHFGTSRDTRW